MRRLLFVMIACACLFTSCFTSSSALKNGTVECEVSSYTSAPSEYRDLVSFRAYAFNSDDNFIRGFRVYNNSDDRIYIEWENARMLSSYKVYFGDDTRLLMNQPKADEAVSSKSSSISRALTCNLYVDEYVTVPIYKVKDLKNGEEGSTFLKIPIRFSNGKVYDYNVTVRYKWKPDNPTQ